MFFVEILLFLYVVNGGFVFGNQKTEVCRKFGMRRRIDETVCLIGEI
jgi:hypothetical protein